MSVAAGSEESNMISDAEGLLVQAESPRSTLKPMFVKPKPQLQDSFDWYTT